MLGPRRALFPRRGVFTVEKLRKDAEPLVAGLGVAGLLLWLDSSQGDNRADSKSNPLFSCNI